jgi:hypothetical protein
MIPIDINDPAPHDAVLQPLWPSRFYFVPGYTVNVIKEYFLNYNPTIQNDCIVSNLNGKVQVLGAPPADWCVTLIDTGIRCISANG